LLAVIYRKNQPLGCFGYYFPEKSGFGPFSALTKHKGNFWPKSTLEYYALKVGFQKGYREINKIFTGNVYPKNPYLTSKVQYLHCLASK